MLTDEERYAELAEQWEALSNAQRQVVIERVAERLSHRVVGGSSRGSGRVRYEAVMVTRSHVEPCPLCGGQVLIGPGESVDAYTRGARVHSPLWAVVAGKHRILNCIGEVIDRRNVEGRPYDDEEQTNGG